MTAPLQSVLHPAGPDALIMSQMAWIVMLGGAAIFFGVMLVLLLALRGPGKPVRPLRWLLGAGVVMPLLVLSALLAWSTWRSAGLAQPSSLHDLKIAVNARMWWWQVAYADPAGGPDIVLANEIRLPQGRDAYLGLGSADVIHSFWVPALAGKIDMLPGRLHGLTLRADQAGIYRGQCAEYCGEQHARMALHVVVMAPADFDAWLKRQALPATAPGTPALVRGSQVFIEQRCASCHTIRGLTDGNGAGSNLDAPLGPDLTHVGSRLYLAAGTLANRRGALAAWIADPHAIKAGVRMPAANMSGADLNALAAYLEQLQ